MGFFSKLIQHIKNRRKKVGTESAAESLIFTSALDTPKWEVFSSIDPGVAAKEVLNASSYSNEIGMIISVYCMVVFENRTQYKLVAPWLGTGRVLEKTNLTDFQVIRVPRDPVKDLLK